MTIMKKPKRKEFSGFEAVLKDMGLDDLDIFEDTPAQFIRKNYRLLLNEEHRNMIEDEEGIQEDLKKNDSSQSIP